MKFTITSATTAAEREACALIMSSSEPWITLGRDYDRCLTNVSDLSLIHI